MKNENQIDKAEVTKYLMKMEQRWNRGEVSEREVELFGNVKEFLIVSIGFVYELYRNPAERIVDEYLKTIKSISDVGQD